MDSKSQECSHEAGGKWIRLSSKQTMDTEDRLSGESESWIPTSQPHFSLRNVTHLLGHGA